LRNPGPKAKVALAGAPCPPGINAMNSTRDRNGNTKRLGLRGADGRPARPSNPPPPPDAQRLGLTCPAPEPRAPARDTRRFEDELEPAPLAEPAPPRVDWFLTRFGSDELAELPTDAGAAASDPSPAGDATGDVGRGIGGSDATPPGRRETPSEAPRGGSVRDIAVVDGRPRRSGAAWRWPLVAMLASALVTGAVFVATGPHHPPRAGVAPAVPEPRSRDEQRQLPPPVEAVPPAPVVSPSVVSPSVVASPVVASPVVSAAAAPAPPPAHEAAQIEPHHAPARRAVTSSGAPVDTSRLTATPVPVIRPKGERRGMLEQ
jgi:hypothetical protein